MLVTLSPIFTVFMELEAHEEILSIIDSVVNLLSELKDSSSEIDALALPCLASCYYQSVFVYMQMLDMENAVNRIILALDVLKVVAPMHKEVFGDMAVSLIEFVKEFEIEYDFGVLKQLYDIKD